MLSIIIAPRTETLIVCNLSNQQPLVDLERDI
ncbi:MBL fold metallo-hydrolase [Caenorhabditis elegans]|nr:MBL fold metallo-hydrolase [Caenorhabditis elegans]CDH93102.1 MBL fold metallo-hydrolase [Caenorhabditis elegans]|eukprot:NP_001294373.1 Uncharacterized protein CELE_F36A4.5 [Caenorhabditis elegans]